MSKILTSVFALLILQSILFFQISCSKVATGSFEGNTEAIAKAEAMFWAIGGKAGWAEIRSLYIRAMHDEPQLDAPYQSEIWRDLEEFKVRIEQKGAGAHRVGLFNEEGGWIKYELLDSTRKLNHTELSGWEFSHTRNIYYQLHQLAKNGSKDVRLGPDGRIEFYEDGSLLVAFKLDAESRPEMFYHTNVSGQAETASKFTRWGKSGGLVHPAGGGPVDGSFIFDTEEWTAKKKGIDDAFGVEYSISE